MKIQILFFIALFCRHDFKAGKPQQQLLGARILKLHGGFGVLSAAFDITPGQFATFRFAPV